MPEQFQDADKYSEYLRSFFGRLRSDLAWENLQGFLPDPTRQRRVLDLGGGTGSMSLRLARMELQVVLLDTSKPMLEIARKEAEASGVAALISFQHADASQLAELFEAGSFDAVICHNLLEYVADAAAIVRGIFFVLREDGVFSVLVRNRAGEALKAAIKSSDFGMAKDSLFAHTVVDSLYGMPVRVFDRTEILETLAEAGLEVFAEHGVRVFSDYRDSAEPDSETYRQLLDLELTLGARPEFAAIARYTQMLARRSSGSQASEKGR